MAEKFLSVTELTGSGVDFSELDLCNVERPISIPVSNISYFTPGPRSDCSLKSEIPHRDSRILEVLKTDDYLGTKIVLNNPIRGNQKNIYALESYEECKSQLQD